MGQMHTGGHAKRVCLALMVLVALVTFDPATRQAEASPLDLVLVSAPEISSDFVDVNYDADTHILKVSGNVKQFRSDNDVTSIVNDTFEIIATVSGTGTVTSGAMTVRGKVPALGMVDGVLLSGDLISLGYGEAGGVIEFRFSTSGGSLAGNFGPITGIIVGQSGFNGSFAQSFQTKSIAVATIGKE